jgi:hypothetical protein
LTRSSYHSFPAIAYRIAESWFFFCLPSGRQISRIWAQEVGESAMVRHPRHESSALDGPIGARIPSECGPLEGDRRREDQIPSRPDA